MGVQEILEIAARYTTAMAYAMIRACCVYAQETGEVLRLPKKTRAGSCINLYYADPCAKEWVRLVEGNTDTKQFHM